MKNIVVSIAFGAALCCGAFAQTDKVPEKVIPQKFADEKSVDNEVYKAVLRCIHYDDAQYGIASLLKEGCPKETLAAALHRAAVRTMNAPMASEECALFGTAVYWFGATADDSQLTNILTVAMATTNSYNAAMAAVCYHDRKQHDPVFISCADQLMSKNTLDVIGRGRVWRCLMKDCEGEYQGKSAVVEAVIAVAKKHLFDENEGFSCADELLVKYDPGYAKSPLHEQAERFVKTRAEARKTAAEKTNKELRR